MNIWQQVLDDELIIWGMATHDDATYQEARELLNKLFFIIQEIASDPAVNGGRVLVPQKELAKYAALENIIKEQKEYIDRLEECFEWQKRRANLWAALAQED